MSLNSKTGPLSQAEGENLKKTKDETAIKDWILEKRTEKIANRDGSKSAPDASREEIRKPRKIATAIKRKYKDAMKGVQMRL